MTLTWHRWAASIGLAIALAWIGVTALAPAPPVQARAFTEIHWSDLVPKEWDPTKRFRSLRLDSLDDSDPRTGELLSEMRATWDNAPTVGALAGANVRLAGYVVPLDGVSSRLREFLLVPYFGACIHSPPPPANQIVHVTIEEPARELRVMDAVQVSGTMHTLRQESLMGMSGYGLSAVRVESYPAPH